MGLWITNTDKKASKMKYLFFPTPLHQKLLDDCGEKKYYSKKTVVRM